MAAATPTGADSAVAPLSTARVFFQHQDQAAGVDPFGPDYGDRSEDQGLRATPQRVEECYIAPAAAHAVLAWAAAGRHPDPVRCREWPLDNYPGRISPDPLTDVVPCANVSARSVGGPPLPDLARPAAW